MVENIAERKFNNHRKDNIMDRGDDNESRKLEYKETITKSFLKTVSAFSNYEGGEIIFGIDDDGNVKGIDEPERVRLDIENRINDNITPQPQYSISIDEDKKIISLMVKEGNHKSYFCNSKAYKRNDTSTIEVDSYELTRLVLEGKKMSYENLTSNLQDLTFGYLESKLKEHPRINNLNKDNLTCLNKKSPTSKVRDELCSTSLNKYPMICYSIVSRNNKGG